MSRPGAGGPFDRPGGGGDRDAVPAFAVRGVEVRFGARCALDGVDLTVGRGETVALVGPSGSGKTTLLRVLGAALRPTAGRVLCRGEDLDALTPRALRTLRAHLATIPQHHGLVPNVRVLRNVLLGRIGRQGFLESLRMHLLPLPRAMLHEVHAVLEDLGIGEALHTRTDRLSLGQQQRVAVARALFQRPAAVLADEPTASVDPSRAASVLQALLRPVREDGATLVASLHDPVLARASFERIVGLRDGRVAFDLPAEVVDGPTLDALYAIAGRPPRTVPTP